MEKNIILITNSIGFIGENMVNYLQGKTTLYKPKHK